MLDNVLIGLHNEMDYRLPAAILRLPGYWRGEKIARERAMELLSIFDMQDLAGHEAGSLPYGAQRNIGGYKQSGIGRENHLDMLNHYQQTKNLLVSYSPKALGFF